MNSFYIKPKETDIQHFGTKNMKWGVRHYQYKDGSLTPAGKIRYRKITEGAHKGNAPNLKSFKKNKNDNDSDFKLQKKSELANKGRDLTTSIRELNRGVRHFKNDSIDISKLSNKELQDIVTRMNLEQQYSRLKGSEISRGEAIVDRTLSIGGSALAATGTALSIALAIKQLKQKKS